MLEGLLPTSRQADPLAYLLGKLPELLDDASNLDTWRWPKAGANEPWKRWGSKMFLERATLAKLVE